MEALTTSACGPDSVDLDVTAARAAGMTSVLVGPTDDASADAWVTDLGVLHHALAGPVVGTC